MLQTFIFAMIFLSVAGLVLGIGLWLNRNEALDRRLGQLGNKSNENSEEVAALWQAKVAKVTAPLAWLSTPKEGWDASNFRIRLMQAGLRTGMACHCFCCKNSPGTDSAWPVSFI